MTIPHPTPGDREGVGRDRDHELIFRLMGSDPSRPETMRILLEHCLKAVLRYGKALLDLSGRENSSPELEARTLDTFSDALRHFSTLESQENLQSWILDFARRAFHKPSWNGRLRRGIRGVRGQPPAQPLAGSEHGPRSQRTIHELQNRLLLHKEHELLLLRHLLGLDLHELADIYGVDDRAMLRRLELIRKRLPMLRGQDSDAEHKTRHAAQLFQLKLQAEPDSLSGLHASPSSSCEACNHALSAWKNACLELDRSLQAAWPEPDISPEDFDAYLARLEHSDRGKFRWTALRVPGAEITAIAGITLALIFALRETQRDHTPAVPIFPPTPVHGPTPIPASGAVFLDQSQVEDDAWWTIPAYHVAPRLSDDGRTLSFFYTGDLQQTGDRNGRPDFFRYDIDRDQLEWIQSPARVGSYQMDSTGTADGRLTVLTANLSSIFGFVDYDNCEGPCRALVLYDEGAGSSEWLFAGEEDRQPEPGTAYPYLTSDGRYLSFFSSSAQLSELVGAACPPGDGIQNLQAFLFDRAADELIALPFCVTSDPMAFLPFMEVSKDGRYVLIRTRSEAALAGEDLFRPPEYAVLDRETEELIPFPHSIGPSASATRVLEAHFARAANQIAFSSPTSAIVPIDTNSYVDVFVWDLETGALDLVSAAGGEAADGHSGSRFSAGLPSQGGEFSISADGRYVAFVSLATNLVPGLSLDCGEFFRRSCGNIYLHDRELDTTRVLVQEPLQEAYFTDLSISADGQRIAFLEQRYGCFPVSYCTNLWIHDIGRNYTFDPLWGSEFTRDTAAAGNVVAGQSGVVYPSKTYSLSNSTISAMDLSPQGDLIATGLSSGHTLLWDAASGALLRDLAYQDLPVFQLQFTPAGDRLYAAARDGSLALMDVGTGDLLFRTFETPERFQAMALDPSGEWLALAGHDELWLRSTHEDHGRLEFLQRFEQGPLRSVDFSHDSSVLAVGTGDGTVWLLSMRSRQIFMRLGGHTGRVLRVVFSPQDMVLATGGEDRKLNLWKLSLPVVGQPTADLLLTVLHHEWVGDMSFNPDGSTLACLTFDHDVRFYPVNGSSKEQPFAVIAGGVLLNVSFNRESGAMYLASDLSVMRIDRQRWLEATDHADEGP